MERSFRGWFPPSPSNCCRFGCFSRGSEQGQAGRSPGLAPQPSTALSMFRAHCWGVPCPRPGPASPHSNPSLQPWHNRQQNMTPTSAPRPPSAFWADANVFLKRADGTDSRTSCAVAEPRSTHRSERLYLTVHSPWNPEECAESRRRRQGGLLRKGGIRRSLPIGQFEPAFELCTAGRAAHRSVWCSA